MKVIPEVKEHPIIMQPHSVQQILAGVKTQTRRVVAPGNSTVCGQRTRAGDWFWDTLDFSQATVRTQTTIMQALVGTGEAPFDLHLRVPRPEEESHHRVRPIWDVGEHLWVKESWGHDKGKSWKEFPHRDCVFYRADESDQRTLPLSGRWRSSMFMPRWASRLTLEIVNIRVERLWAITEGDVLAEGIEPQHLEKNRPWFNRHDVAGVTFSEPWDKINGKRKGCAWRNNPWVWVVEFKCMEVTP